jgi:hypothetical protein
VNYDDWKTETPEDEHARIFGPLGRAARRRAWLEDNVDNVLDAERERRAEQNREESSNP